jgi:chromosome segregation ATPase
MIKEREENLRNSLERWRKEEEKREEEIRILKMSLEEKDENCYSLARENEQLKLHVEAKDKAYESLLTDYNYLQARIKRMEKAFLEYVENHKKLEDELDDVIMNR